MVSWHRFGEWMNFTRLDGTSIELDGVYTIGYRFTDDMGDDLWTKRFNDFKRGREDAFYGAFFALGMGVPGLLELLNIKSEQVLFLPALGSQDTHAMEDSKLTMIAEAAAVAVGAKCDLGVLTKNKHKPLHKCSGAAAREAELDKANYAASMVSAKNVFVVDDFVTRGSTISHIANAVKAANTSVKVFGIALAKTEKLKYRSDLNNSHVNKIWNERWQEGEKHFAANG